MTTYQNLVLGHAVSYLHISEEQLGSSNTEVHPHESMLPI